jgi:micrococcal nuclease
MLNTNYIKSKQFILTAVLLFIFIIASAFVLVSGSKKAFENGWLDFDSPNSSESSEKDVYTVIHVADGDTIEVENQFETLKIRYIGVDTPETVKPNSPVECFGKKASEFNKTLTLNKKVRLESDAGDTDQYGRKLRYVYLLEGEYKDQMVNEILLENGYATLLTVQPNVKYVDRFKKLEAEARIGNKGLWKECKV